MKTNYRLAKISQKLKPFFSTRKFLLYEIYFSKFSRFEHYIKYIFKNTYSAK